MTSSKWKRGTRAVVGVFALGLLVGLAPNAAKAQPLCGNGVVDGPGGDACVGDCNEDGAVTVDEIVTMVSAALAGGIGGCPAGDSNMDGSITVDEIVTAVNNALNGCPEGSGGGPAAPEQCDNGGLCVGGADAGDACTAEGDCDGDGACFGGLDNLRGCTSDANCREGVCRKCRPYGGDGCAANCTDESDQNFNLVPGVLAPGGAGITEGTSGAVVNGPFLTVPLPLSGSQILTLGTIVDGQATAVLKASGIDLDRIPVSTIACACVRGAESRTCGGTLFDAAGVQSANCTAGFAGAETCPVEKKCAAVHGPGNTGSGFIECGEAPYQVEFTQDCNGTPGGEPLDPVVTVSPGTGTPPATEGAGFLVITSAIGTVVGACAGGSADYGPDGQFCTDDDPQANRGTPNSIPFTTGMANGIIFNPGDFEGDQLPPPGETLGATGAPFTCAAGGETGTISISATNLAGVFTSCDQPTVSDIVVPNNFVAQ